MKKSFLLHIDSLCILNDLTDEQSGQLFKAMYLYQIGEVLELSPIIKIAFSQFKNQFDRDNEKYIKTCEVRKQAGSKGGKQRVANQANANKTKQDEANQAEKENENKNEKENKNEIDIYSLTNTKKDFSLFIKELQDNSLIKSKVTKGQGNAGYESYIKIEDKKKLHDDYIKHQSECKKYSKTITNYMLDYEAIKSGVLEETKQQPIKPKDKTLDEVLNIYIHQRKIHTNKDYTFAKCKEMLHWNLHKEFTKLSTSFEQKMMLAYGYDWVNGRIDFTTDENIIEVENR